MRNGERRRCEARCGSLPDDRKWHELAGVWRIGACRTRAWRVEAQEYVEPDCISTPACESDGDCSDGTSCLAVTACTAEVDRSCRDDESDEECATRTRMLSESNCQMVEKHICLPTWALDCSDDSDCPDGFACVGTPGTPCKPRDKTCEIDANCPAGWLCETYDTGFCTGGAGCVGNQTQETACVAPRSRRRVRQRMACVDVDPCLPARFE
jgi:hypothetical protein